MAPFEMGPLLIILLVVLLLFGASALPKLMRSLGRAKGEFTRAKAEFDSEASRAASPTSAGASEAQVRQAARNLGIDEAGMSLDEVKRQLNQRLG